VICIAPKSQKRIRAPGTVWCINYCKQHQ